MSRLFGPLRQMGFVDMPHRPVRRTRFPVFPVDPGISPISPVPAPFGRENGKPDQRLAGEFP